MGNTILSQDSAILDQNVKTTEGTSLGHDQPCSCLYVSQSPNTVIRNDCEKAPYVNYWEFRNFPLVGHLGLRFQNEAMYIKGL